MLYLILAGIVALALAIGVLLAIGAGSEPNHSDGPDRSSFVTFSITMAIILGIVTVAFSMTIVSARTVGIYTSFGKEAGTRPAGLGWTAPWESKEEFPTNVQYLELNRSENGDGATSVNYKGGGKGEVDATIRWRMDETRAMDLWRKYREFDRVTDQLVKSAARDAVGVVVGAYAPNDARAGENRRKITDDVVADLTRTLADDGIRIDSVSVSDIRLDENTQRSIEAIIKANADVERARAEKERAEIDNQTANLRAKSAALSAGALQLKCLEVTNAWDQAKNGPLPATWNCLNTVTSPPSVVVGQR